MCVQEKYKLKPRGGERYAHKLRPGNFFEAMAVVLSHGSQHTVKPNMDWQNDSCRWFNMMGSLTYTGSDNKGAYRVGVLGYTRNCVGDYLA